MDYGLLTEQHSLGLGPKQVAQAARKISDGAFNGWIDLSDSTPLASTTAGMPLLSISVRLAEIQGELPPIGVIEGVASRFRAALEASRTATEYAVDIEPTSANVEGVQGVEALGSSAYQALRPSAPAEVPALNVADVFYAAQFSQVEVPKWERAETVGVPDEETDEQLPVAQIASIAPEQLPFRAVVATDTGVQ